MLKEKLERIDAIDLIRGYLLFVIIIDHLFRFFSGYEILTGRGTQWVSAAEGFFFVSGMMIGLVRARKLREKPLWTTAKKLLSRAFTLYIWSIALTFFFTFVAWLFAGNEGIKPGAFADEPISKLITYTLSLRYIYSWADFLPFYVIYLALSPLVIWLLRRGLWYIVPVLSIGAWLLGDNVQTTWQLLFFSGSIVGYYLPEIEHYFKNLAKPLQTIGVFTLSALAGITLSISIFFNVLVDILYHHPTYPQLGLPIIKLFELNSQVLAPWFDKYNLAIGRLLLFALWFTALYVLTRKYEAIIKKYVGWFFILYGQNSLYVYIVHAFIVYGVWLALPYDTPFLANFAINTAVLATIWYMLRKKFLFKIIPR